MGAERATGPGMTRRQALLLAGAGALTAGIGASGLLRGWGFRAGAGPGGTLTGAALVEPTVLASDRGTLRVTLTAATGRTEIAGRSVRALSYNGSVPGPTLRLRPGDHLTLNLENRLGTATNLHTHGLHVSPEGNGDNVFLHIGDGQTFQYEYQIPTDHPAGTFWYHPHLHEAVADQLFGGLAGAIIIDRDDSAPLPVDRERTLVVMDTTLDGDRIAGVTMRDRMLGREGELVLVNGQLEPAVAVRTGVTEHWRVINACSSRFMRLRLPGAQLWQVAGDAGPLAAPVSVEEVFLASGNRVGLLVRPPAAGAYRLVAEPVNRGAAAMLGTAGGGTSVDLVHLQATGSAVPAPRLPARLADLDDLRAATIDGNRQLTFAMAMGMGAGMRFTIDGKEFDPNRVDTEVRLGRVEEWTIRNTSPMDHPFHLHVWPVQVVARNGTPVAGSPQWLDVVTVPAFGTVTLRLRLSDYPGRSVYHCHILDHEDLGMMGVVRASP